jgi:large subunit ribosomal protein L10
MSANKDSKVALVAEIKDKLSKAKSMIVVNYSGTTVEKDSQLRNEFRKENVEYHVYKNRLVLRALKELGYDVEDEALQGTNSFAISYDDETAGARILNNFMKENSNMTFVLGTLGNQVLSKEKVETIAKLPSKPALIGQLLSVLNGPIRGVCVALNAYAEKKGQN